MKVNILDARLKLLQDKLLHGTRLWYERRWYSEESMRKDIIWERERKRAGAVFI